MYDELIKNLRGRSQFLLPHYGEETSYDSDLMKQAADAIENMSEAYDKLSRHMDDLAALMPRWIPVTERLPEVRTWVLCYCRANSFDVFRMTDEGHWQYGNRSIYMKGYVTHWMPLPEPPKEET